MEEDGGDLAANDPARDPLPARISVEPDVAEFEGWILLSYYPSGGSVHLQLATVGDRAHPRPLRLGFDFETSDAFLEWWAAGVDGSTLIERFANSLHTYRGDDGVDRVVSLESVEVVRADVEGIEIAGTFSDGTTLRAVGPLDPLCENTGAGWLPDETPECWAQACALGLDIYVDTDLTCE